MSELGYDVGRLTTTDAVILDDVVELGLLIETREPVNAPLGVLCPVAMELLNGALLEPTPTLSLVPIPARLNCIRI